VKSRRNARAGVGVKEMTQINIERSANGRETITVTVKSGFAFRVVVVYGKLVFLHGATAADRIRVAATMDEKELVDDTLGIYPAGQSFGDPDKCENTVDGQHDFTVLRQRPDRKGGIQFFYVCFFCGAPMRPDIKMTHHNDTDKAPGAGGQGTAGYWGSSTDETREEAFEKRYRLLIPKGLYKTSTHSPLTCGVCTNERGTMFYCPAGGVGFGALPVVEAREGEYRVARCGLCNEVRSKRKIHHKKRLSARENPTSDQS